MKKILLAMTAIALVNVALTNRADAQQFNAQQRDSLMNAAEQWRTMGNNSAALNIYAKLTTERARLETAETHIEMGQIALALREAQSMLRDKGFRAKDDALLIVARCRDVQGFTSATNRAYRRLAKHNHAEGLYYAAMRKYTSGHLQEAEDLCQRAIKADASVTPAHQLLGAVEVSLGHRYRALLPLYYHAMTASDEGRAQSVKQIRTLWRKSAKAIDILHTHKPTDKFNDMMDSAIDSLANDSITKVDEYDAICMLADKTEALMEILKTEGEYNLDFWQIQYGDMMTEIHTSGLCRPMTFFICSSTWPQCVKEWVQTPYGGPAFRDFERFMSTRLQ